MKSLSSTDENYWVIIEYMKFIPLFFIFYLILLFNLASFGQDKKTTTNSPSGASSSGNSVTSGSTTTPGSTDLNSGKLFGGAAFMTNFVEHGITQTLGDPALQGEFGYQFSLFRFGLKGSNVKFLNLNEHLNVRAFGEYNLFFTTNIKGLVRFALNNYYTSNLRNGNIMTFDINAYDYHVAYGKQVNFESLEVDLTSYTFYKDWEFSNKLLLQFALSYNILDYVGYKNFLDIKFSIGYRFAEINYFLSVTANSAAEQFNGRGNTYIAGIAEAKF